MKNTFPEGSQAYRLFALLTELGLEFEIDSAGDITHYGLCEEDYVTFLVGGGSAIFDVEFGC